MRPTTARRSAVAVCGAGSCDTKTAAVAEELGRLIVQEGYALVCGGMGGVMEAACRGGQLARQQGAAGLVVGLLPGGELDGGNPFCDVVIPTAMAQARNALVARSGDVVILVGGGSGTLSEAALAWQLGKPLIALRCCAGWAARLAGEALDDRRQERIIPADSPAAALAAVREALR